MEDPRGKHRACSWRQGSQQAGNHQLLAGNHVCEGNQWWNRHERQGCTCGSRSPSLRLLSLNVNGLWDTDKRHCLFNLLERDKWDVILLQETHHSFAEKGEHGRRRGPTGSAAIGAGPRWCHYTSQSRGVAVVLRPTAHTSANTVRHSNATRRTLLVDFTLLRQPTQWCPSTRPAAAERPRYYTQELLPSLPADRHLLVGGDFNCIAGQQDMLDPAGQPG